MNSNKKPDRVVGIIGKINPEYDTVNYESVYLSVVSQQCDTQEEFDTICFRYKDFFNNSKHIIYLTDFLNKNKQWITDMK